MNRQWLHWRSYTATDALGLDQDLVRPVIEQAMLEAIETERSEQRGFLQKLDVRLRAIAQDLMKLQHTKDAQGELVALAELCGVLSKQLTEVEQQT